MPTTSRFLGAGIVLGLAAGLLVGVGLGQPGRAAATTPTAIPSAPSTGADHEAVAAPPAVTVGGATGASVASSGAAIAYPYFAGSPGIAPDHTILVTGVGQADVNSDGSDRAAAQKMALATALADAKTQATQIAAVTGLSISGVLSVSASVAPSYGILPMAAIGSGTPSCVPGAPAGGTQPTAQPLVEPACPPVAPPAYQQTLSVSVTVAYRVG